MSNILRNMIWQIDNAYIRVRNFLRWLPYIWRDQHWDYSFLLKLLEQKLRFMEECFSGIHPRRNRAETILQIQGVIRLLEAHNTDAYTDRALQRVKEKWGNFEFVFEDSEYKDGDGTPLLEMKDPVFERANTEEENAKANAEMRKALDEARIRENKMWERIWNSLAFYTRGWWD